MNDLKDRLYELLQEPTREKFSLFLDKHTGEEDCIDFKEEMINDYSKLAKIVLGIANSNGGAIIFGVKETDTNSFLNIGLNVLIDKGEIYQKLQKYLPDVLKIEIKDFDYSGEEYSKLKDKKFQIIVVKSNDVDLPYICENTGEKVKEGAIYVRRGTNTLDANKNDIDKLLMKRLGVYSREISSLELEEHLNQLKTLYKYIGKRIMSSNAFTNSILNINNLFATYEDNEKYPKEDFDDFVLTLIDKKKRKIEKVIDL